MCPQQERPAVSGGRVRKAENKRRNFKVQDIVFSADCNSSEICLLPAWKSDTNNLPLTNQAHNCCKPKPRSPKCWRTFPTRDMQKHPDGQHPRFKSKPENPGILSFLHLWESQLTGPGQDPGPCGLPGRVRKESAAIAALCSQARARAGKMAAGAARVRRHSPARCPLSCKVKEPPQPLPQKHRDGHRH